MPKAIPLASIQNIPRLARLERRLPAGGFFFVVLLALVLSSWPVPGSASSYLAVIDAARLGRTAEMLSLIQRGLDVDTVDEQGNSLLMLAAREGLLANVEALIAQRARLGMRNAAGDSALMLAVLRGHEEVVDRLLEAGAPLNHEGWTALQYAAFEGRVGMIEKLLQRGADPALLAPNYANPLMLAARNGHMNAVRVLLPVTPNLEQNTDQGHTAETWALSAGNTDIAELIRAERMRRPLPHAPASSLPAQKAEEAAAAEAGEGPALRIEIE